MDFSIFLEPTAWVAFLTLTFLEVVLGIDNIVFISIVSNKLEKKDQPLARNVGLLLGMGFRILLLFGISWVLQLNNPIPGLIFNNEWIDVAINGQSLIIMAGGLFLLYKSVSEIHHKLEDEEEESMGKKAVKSLVMAIIQIGLLDLVFSFDSVLTAIGLVSFDNPPVGYGYEGGMTLIIVAIVITIMVMMIFAGPVSKFINEHPTIQILGLSFLILIGVMLLVEASHAAHLSLFGSEVHSIPKGYLYFAIFFSLFVEFLNMKFRKKGKSVQLRNSTIMDEELKDMDPFD